MKDKLVIKKKRDIKQVWGEERMFTNELIEHFGFSQSTTRNNIIKHLENQGYIELPRGVKLSRRQTIRLCRMVAHHFFTPEKLTAIPSKNRPVKCKKKKTKPKKKWSQKKEFLNSWEWRTLRYKILLKHGRRCMCCGASPDDGVTVIHVDHIKPRHTHPELSLDPDNLQVLCGVCNQGKGAWDDTDFRDNVIDWEEVRIAHEAKRLQ